MARTALVSPNLEVGDLRLVLALAESGSTVHAAAVLHLTQSAVSRGLLAVEDRLGTPLFTRHPRGLALTAAGRRFISGAGAVLGQLAAFEEHVRHGDAGTVPLRIVCECYTAYRWLPGTLSALRPSVPSLDVTVAMEHTQAPVPALLARKVDVALLTTAKPPKGIVSAPLFSDEIVFVMAASHPLAERDSIGVESLRDYPMITSSATPEREHQWFMRQLFGNKPKAFERLQFPLTETVIDATRARMGIAAMSEWVAAPYVAGGELVAKPFRGRRLLRPWRIAYRSEVATAAKQLAAALTGAPPRLFESRA